MAQDDGGRGCRTSTNDVVTFCNMTLGKIFKQFDLKNKLILLYL